MIDNPDPIERTGADPVTPDAVKARVNEFFAGIDLSKNGEYSQGLIGISVYNGPLRRVSDPANRVEIKAQASVNGILIAQYFEVSSTEPEVHTAESYKNPYYFKDRKIWFLVGMDNGENRIAVQYNDDSDMVSMTRDKKTHSFERVTDPKERAEVAQRLGIRV